MTGPDDQQACEAFWNDPDNDDAGYMCDREQGHVGDHAQTVRWPSQPVMPAKNEATR